jgi:putative two-component system response regulator
MDRDLLGGAAIVIVEDYAANRIALEAVLLASGAGPIRSTGDPLQVAALVAAQEPDLILLDWRLPGGTGAGVLATVAAHLAPGTYLPILVLTADATPATRAAALAAGAHDFLIKPFDAEELLLRCHNLLTTRRLHQQLQQHIGHLAELVALRTAALESAHLDILGRLARAVEARDDLTGRHTLRVGRWAARLAVRIGAIVRDERPLFEQAAALHDLGKIAVPDAILRKPGPLTAAERAVMEQHTTIGAALLAGPASHPLTLAQTIAWTHHERWDGRGYPTGLAGPAIPLVGRVVAVVDAWDALTHARPYKAAWARAAARQEIAAQSGRQFDPAVVQAFLHLLADQPRTVRPRDARPPE